MYLYYASLLQYASSGECSIAIRRARGKVISIWHQEFCERYLSSVFMMIRTLTDPRPINMGALGSHHNENFFGAIKRLSNNDESIEQFRTASEKALALKVICNSYGLRSVKQDGRKSMSGARLPSEGYSDMAIGYHFSRAMQLWSFVADYGTTVLARQWKESAWNFEQAAGMDRWKDKAQIIELIPSRLIEAEEGRRDVRTITLRKTRQVSTSGTKCHPRFISHQQATKQSS